MIFTTPEFVLFFACFWLVFATTRGHLRKGVVLAASYLFYAAWDPRFLALLIGSTILDFWVGKRLAQTAGTAKRRRLLLVSLVGNLGVLATFKYYDFFATSAGELLTRVGWTVEPTTLHLVLPVGISFYTFQTLSYTVDIYRGRQEPCRSLLDFANFVAFFPQLVAGPIERAKDLLPQLAALGKRVQPDTTGWGLIAIGCFKKVVIADNLAPLVEATYADPSSTYPLALWLGTYAFAVQIYCDFSGYTDIAIGLARLMGVRLGENFNAPYAATGPRDFWRRWHISLSSWLRDYLYIPLGGNRGTAGATGRNLMATMVLGGLWHGAAWNFVLWGAYHGVLLIAARVTAIARVATTLPTWVRRLVFFQLVCLGWALFRAQSLGECRTIWAKLLNPFGFEPSRWFHEVEASGEAGLLAILAGLGLTVVGWHMLVGSDTQALVTRLWRMPWLVRLYLVVVVLVACALLAPEAPPAFLYFQF